MNQPLFAKLTAIVIVAAGFLSGCKEEPPPPSKKPARKVITLRVVMFVETGADLTSPPLDTGGCKLTRAQVDGLVDELIAFGNNAAPGIVFVWDRAIQRLESDCLRVQPWPFPPCTSVCGDLDAPGRCPRRLDLVWIVENVVGHPAGGPADLQQADNYIDDNCTMNIYFLGKVLVQGAQNVAGTIIPNTLGIRAFVYIMDMAATDPTGSPDPVTISNRKTVAHEAVCHWLLEFQGHPTPTGANPCPKNLCIDGATTLDAPQCQAVYNGKRPEEVLTSVQEAILTNTQECGE